MGKTQQQKGKDLTMLTTALLRQLEDALPVEARITQRNALINKKKEMERAKAAKEVKAKAERAEKEKDQEKVEEKPQREKVKVKGILCLTIPNGSLGIQVIGSLLTSGINGLPITGQKAEAKVKEEIPIR